MRSNPVFETRKAVAAQGEDRLQDSREVTLRHAFKALGEMVRRLFAAKYAPDDPDVSVLGEYDPLPDHFSKRRRN